MAKVITQETFDDVVKENIVEFSMSAEESREETVKQFEAQGINLANIIKDLNVNDESGVPLLNESVEWLKTQGTDLSGADKDEVCKHLATVVAECKLVSVGGKNVWMVFSEVEYSFVFVECTTSCVGGEVGGL